MEVLIVFITLVMGVLSIGVYINVQDKMERALVLPDEMLKIRDETAIIEHNEKIIFSELKETHDVNIMKREACKKLYEYRKYYAHNLHKDGRRIQEEILDNAGDWNEFCRRLYDVKIENNLIKVSKNNNEYYRRIDLIPQSREKIAFTESIEYYFSGYFEIEI